MILELNFKIPVDLDMETADSSDYTEFHDIKDRMLEEIEEIIYKYFTEAEDSGFGCSSDLGE